MTKNKILAALLINLLVATLVLYSKITAEAEPAVVPREGDVVFQESKSRQNTAIKEATGSRYTHCGIVFERDGRMWVYESLATMAWTPLERWIARGVDGHYVHMRLKGYDQIMTPEKIAAMKKAGAALAGKKYDLLFQWSDDTIYCSELVWKIYERGVGLELSRPREFREFNLDGLTVKAVAKERYGRNLPLDEKAVAPSDLMASPFLETVGQN